jgi:nitrogenase molybdenum-iron protein NifN
MSNATAADRWTVTRNACKLCTPLGACLAFKGIENCISFLHGSQGCSTYIRRYMISHFKEPIDIACSNFSEHTAVFGGASDLHRGLDNILRQYNPEVVGIMTTCLAETIGEDVGSLVKKYREERPELATSIVHVSTPSYRGTHAEGFYDAVWAMAEQLAEPGDTLDHINLLPGMLSPADLRHLKELVGAFGVDVTLLPDYSDTLDGGPWTHYNPIPPGGTPLAKIRAMGQAKATVELGHVLARRERTAGRSLLTKAGVPLHSLGLPIGISETDRFCAILEEITGQPLPEYHEAERRRLIDAYADGHKYISGKRAVVYGEEDFACSMALFLMEIGITPILVASGGRTGLLEECMAQEPSSPDAKVVGDVDFMDIGDLAQDAKADLVIGNSKGYKLSKQLEIPLVRVGFPVHDRFGASRFLHVGYRGAQQLFDRIVNAVIEHSQESNPVGYTYI